MTRFALTVIREAAGFVLFVGLAVALVCLAGALSGCDARKPADWHIAPHTHVCTAEQMERAESEAQWCQDNTTYLSTYCYGSAILRNCTKRKTETENTP